MKCAWNVQYQSLPQRHSNRLNEQAIFVETQSTTPASDSTTAQYQTGMETSLKATRQFSVLRVLSQDSRADVKADHF